MVRRWILRLLWAMMRAPVFLLLGVAGGFGRARVIDPAKVAIYIRWSTDDQSEGTTLDTQRDACQNQARAWGFGTIPDDRVFIDDGYSGGDLNRPGITRIRQLVNRGQIHCVIVYRIDRLSRNIVDATSLVLREWDGACDLRCVMDPVDTTTEVGRMFFGILAMFADYERQTIRARTASGRTRRASEGRNPGVRLPYGYRQGERTGVIVRDDAQAAVVRRIFEAYAAGQGCITIAARLNQEGYTSWSGGPWSQSTIQKMLQNEAYIGRMIYGRSTRNRRRDTAGGPVRLRLEEPAVVRDNVYPPIVDHALFERCRQIRLVRAEALARTSGRALSSTNLLTGLVRCSKCGHSLRAWKPGSSTPNKKPAYTCEGRTTKGLTVCDAARIQQQALDDLVVAEVRQLTRPDFRGEFLARHARSLEARVRDLQAQIAGAEAQLRELDSQEKAALRDYRSREISAATLEDLRAEITRERQQLTHGLATLKARLSTAQQSEQDRARLEDTLSLVDSWDQWDTAQRKQILRDLILDLTAYRAPGSDRPQVAIRYRVLDETDSEAPIV